MTSDEWADSLEADIRRKMAEHAAIKPRGTDSARRRWLIRTQIDNRLDELAAGPPNPRLTEAAKDTEHGDPAAVKCGVCGRSRYRNAVGSLLCAACDNMPSGTAWQSADGRGTE